MGNYIIKRILTGIFSLFVLITVTFFLTRSMPGSPFQSSNISPNMVETMEKEYGLDEPAAVQYKNYLTGLLRGDMGISYKKQGVRGSNPRRGTKKSLETQRFQGFSIFAHFLFVSNVLVT